MSRSILVIDPDADFFKEKLLALRFDSLNLGEKSTLARYVFKRISS